MSKYSFPSSATYRCIRDTKVTTTVCNDGIYVSVYEGGELTRGDTWHPMRVERLMDRLSYNESVGLLDDLVFGETISVKQDASGLWTEVKSNKHDKATN